MARCNLSEVNFSSTYHTVCTNAFGNKKWEETTKNLVVDEGIMHLMERGFNVETVTPEEWWVGLFISGTAQSTDTMQSHPDWHEFLGVTSIYRGPIAFSPKEPQTASEAMVGGPSQIVIATAGTISGAFLTTGKDRGGSEGLLYGVTPFSEQRYVVVGDAIQVTITLGGNG